MLVACPECQKQISSESEYCIGCGYRPKESKAVAAQVATAQNVNFLASLVKVGISFAIVIFAVAVLGPPLIGIWQATVVFLRASGVSEQAITLAGAMVMLLGVIVGMVLLILWTRRKPRQ